MRLFAAPNVLESCAYTYYMSAFFIEYLLKDWISTRVPHISKVDAKRTAQQCVKVASSVPRLNRLTITPVGTISRKGRFTPALDNVSIDREIEVMITTDRTVGHLRGVGLIMSSPSAYVVLHFNTRLINRDVRSKGLYLPTTDRVRIH